MSLLIKATAKGSDAVTLTANLSQETVDRYNRDRSVRNFVFTLQSINGLCGMFGKYFRAIVCIML